MSDNLEAERNELEKRKLLLKMEEKMLNLKADQAEM
jgi:hypothetical protein